MRNAIRFLAPLVVALVFRANAGCAYNPNMSTVRTVPTKVRSTPVRSRCTRLGPARALEASKLVPPSLPVETTNGRPQSPPFATAIELVWPT